MKKLISAVTSICMTATMFTAVAPASVSALDDTKTLSLRTIGGGNTYTVSAEEIAAGDVTLHCGMYLGETTEGDITSGQCLFGLRHSSTGSMDDITLTNLGDLRKNYYTKDTEFTTSEGVTFTTRTLPFALAEIDDFGEYSAMIGEYQVKYADTKLSLGVDLPSIAWSWTYPTAGGTAWMGATSDEYPMYYFDVTLKQGASGTYVIDFYDDVYNDSPTNLQPACNLGSRQVGYEYYPKNQDKGEGILNLEGLTIIVGDNEESGTTTTTTTTNPKQTTTTTTTSDPGTTTTTTSGASGDKVVIDYMYPDGEDCYKANAGDTVTVDMTIDSKGQAYYGIDLSLLTDPEIIIKSVSTKSAAFGSTLTVNVDNDDVFDGVFIIEGEKHHHSGDKTSLLANGAVNDSDTNAPTVPDAEASALKFLVNVPDGTPDGTYYVNLQYIYLQTAQANTATGAGPEYVREGDVVYNAAKIVVGDAAPQTTTTTTTTSTTTTTTTTTTPPATTTTTTTPVPGQRLLGDANVDGKVNVADIVVLNKLLAGNGDLTDQGKINAEVTNPTLKVEDVDLTYDDSTYIIQSIIHLWTLTDDGPVATEYYGK